MSDLKLIFVYSARIVTRQWRTFVLPFLSLSITAVVLTLILLITQASSLLLDQQSRALLGGDIVLETTKPIDTQVFWEKVGIQPTQQSDQLSFSGTLQSSEISSPFSIQVVDDSFPLYGEVTLAQGTFEKVGDSEIYLDDAGAKKLGVTVGNTVTFGTQSFTLAGIIVSEPTSLFGGFRFLPRAFMSQSGFSSAGIDPQLLRVEYVYATVFPNLTNEQIATIRSVEESYGRGTVHVDIAGQDQRGLQFGLNTVSSFLIVAVLMTSILAAVNVYASTLYLVSTERKSLAILLALGLPKYSLIRMLGASLAYIVVLSCVVGIVVGNGLFAVLVSYIGDVFRIQLPTPHLAVYGLITSALIGTIATASFIPAMIQSLSLNPKQILIGGEEDMKKQTSLKTVALISISTLVPLIIFASYLLESVVYGVLTILAIALVYIVIAGLFSYMLSLFYKRRARYSFFVRSIISQKKADGFFGIISFTSLFIALVSISSLALIQLSLQNYLTNDLAQSVPTTYVLDIQPSQKDIISERFPQVVLYANIRARIIAIDSLRVQDELTRPDSTLDRELGREFNLTSRNDLLSNELITQGVWGEGRKGEVSVDEEFANRASIKLGSKLVFSIQGFEVEGIVTSFRSTDSRSGLPFFYFVLSPQDVGTFPSVYFGYSYADTAEQNALSTFVGTEMPNISVIDTQSIGPQIIKLVETLLILVLVVTLPPLLIATLLISTLVISSYASRRREGARLRAIGATRAYVLRHYLIETVSLTLFSAVISYALSVLISYGINTFFLKLDSTVFFDTELLVGLGLIVTSIGCIGLYLFKTDTMPLRELLSYESNI